MGFSQLQYEIIVKALQSRVRPFCSSCGKQSWVIQTEGLVSVQIQTYQPPPAVPKVPFMRYWNPIGPSGRVMPCIATVCTNCGVVQLYNIFTLGIADALGISAGGQ